MKYVVMQDTIDEICYNHIRNEKYVFLLIMQFNDFTSVLKNTNNPFLVGRLSGNETVLCGIVLSGLNIPLNHMLFKRMENVAGIFFKDKDSVNLYVKMYYESICNSDLLGVWDGMMKSQAQLFYNRMDVDPRLKSIPKFDAKLLEPFYNMDRDDYDYDMIFNNKKLLIISSHYESMISQMSNIDKIFNKPIFGKQSSIEFIKPPLTMGGNHSNKDWKEHFDIFCNTLDNIDFDIALVSCGGYGMITSNYIKHKLNKIAIYVGGPLQLFFGIKGGRWNNYPWYNEYWIEPLKKDIPKNRDLVEMYEGKCYW